MTYRCIDVVATKSFGIISVKIEQLRNIVAGVIISSATTISIRPCGFLRSIVMSHGLLIVEAGIQCKFQGRQELEPIVDLDVGECAINNRTIVSLLYPRQRVGSCQGDRN